jgi:hypothetical protein
MHQSAIAEAQNENREMLQKFLRDFYKESIIKKMGFHLMKNVDTCNLMNRFASQIPLEVSFRAMGSQRDAKNSQDLKYGFQDYTFKVLNRFTLEEKPSRSVPPHPSERGENSGCNWGERSKGPAT